MRVKGAVLAARQLAGISYDIEHWCLTFHMQDSLAHPPK